MKLTPPDEWTTEQKKLALTRFLEAERRLLDDKTPAFIRNVALPRIRKQINEIKIQIGKA